MIGRSLLISYRSLEFDAVAFGISQVNGRALAVGTVAQGLWTTDDVMLCQMFGDRCRVKRIYS
jgi:hypothetical protein